MKKRLLYLLLSVCCLTGLAACQPQDTPTAPETDEPPAAPTPAPDPAAVYVDSLTPDEQLAQLFFVRCPETGAAELAAQYNIGGYLLFGRDFEGQTPDSMRETIRSYQDAAKTPLLIGVDEEGGTVVRVSANPSFRAARFGSPQSLYRAGGLARIISDTAEKDALLRSIGVNVNLAPVCDVSTDPNDFIYARTLGRDAAETGAYAAAVVAQMREDGMGMVLKHFPGYGANADTHTGIAVDERPLEQFRAVDFVPFQAGVDAGAQAVLVCHNIVTCMDASLPASLSPAVHDMLRDELGFDGVVMTDDLIMDAITRYTDGADAAVRAVQAGNDMLISSDFLTQFEAVRAAVASGEISADTIRAASLRVIRWKMALSLL